MPFWIEGGGKKDPHRNFMRVNRQKKKRKKKGVWNSERKREKKNRAALIVLGKKGENSVRKRGEEAVRPVGTKTDKGGKKKSAWAFAQKRDDTGKSLGRKKKAVSPPVGRETPGKLPQYGGGGEKKKEGPREKSPFEKGKGAECAEFV